MRIYWLGGPKSTTIFGHWGSLPQMARFAPMLGRPANGSNAICVICGEKPFDSIDEASKGWLTRTERTADRGPRKEFLAQSPPADGRRRLASWQIRVVFSKTPGFARTRQVICAHSVADQVFSRRSQRPQSLLTTPTLRPRRPPVQHGPSGCCKAGRYMNLCIHTPGDPAKWHNWPPLPGNGAKRTVAV